MATSPDPRGILRIFISSTSLDLQDYREAVRDAVLGLDQHPTEMILWSADERSATASSVDRVREADVLILLVAHRYGHVPDGEVHSVTELEYRAAWTAEVPVLAFFLDPTVAWPPDHIEWEARDKLLAFKALVEAAVTRKVFRSPDDLARQVVQALALLVARRPAPSGRRGFKGRVRAVSLPAQLATEPDVLVPIGTAEDRLPLLLDVRRGRDLSGPLAGLAAAIGGQPSGGAAPIELDALARSLAEFGRRTWSADRIPPVALALDNEAVADMYVTVFTLSGPFRSILAGLVEASANRWVLYRTPVDLAGQHELDIFHDPALYLDPQAWTTAPDGLRAWRGVIEWALQFDPSHRPSKAGEFADQLAAVAASYPLDGDRSITPTGRLMAARLVDGTEAVARMINNGMQPLRRASTFAHIPASHRHTRSSPGLR